MRVLPGQWLNNGLVWQMSDYTKELAKDVLDWYNIDFTESESGITLFLFDTKKMAIEPTAFSSWEDVLREMLPTMEESNKDTYEEIWEYVWSYEEILYVKLLGIAKDKVEQGAGQA